jgi:pimeloyl-ACP methyl ester carboxylesterase
MTYAPTFNSMVPIRPASVAMVFAVVLGTLGCGSTRRSPSTPAEPETSQIRPPLPAIPRGDITPRKLAAWRRTDAEWAHWTDPSPHRVLFIPVAGRSLGRAAGPVRLEVLDWGGTGPAVVLLAGSGGTAHVYDDLAPQLVERFRVVGITRRGHGASSRAADTMTYTLDTLVADIGTVLDSLGIRRASLVGHSIAGAEITRFAARWPDRVEKLVYLDAAHDFDGYDELLAANPSWPPPVAMRKGTHNDSLNTWRDWGKRDLWGYWSDAMEVDRVRTYDADSFALRVLVRGATLHPKEYSAVRAPALALSAWYTTGTWFFHLDALRDSAKWQEASRWIESAVRPFIARGNKRFLDETPNGRLVQFDSDHYVFIFREERTLAELRQFLGQSVGR